MVDPCHMKNEHKIYIRKLFLKNKLLPEEYCNNNDY